ncbi:MAG TPA: PorV/PorQ family protein [Acidobacteriota bacterium]|nr:PorV/PorQ family protein [Acidobacteriota bacterium]
MKDIVKYVSCSLVLAGAVMPTGLLTAGGINGGAGTSAFSFLKINVGARPVALGGAFTGVADDENSLYYNPAGIASLERHGIIAGYHNYFVDLQSGLVGYVHQSREKHFLAGYISYLNYGEFTQTDNLGTITGEFGGGDVLFGVTFATRYRENIYAGATGKLIYEKIQGFSASGMALDVGLKYRSNRGRYTAGLMLQNLGIQLSNFTDADHEPLPLMLRVGGGIRPRGLPMLFSADVMVPRDNDVDVAVGGEYYELKPLYLRIGWNSFGSNYRATSSDDSMAGVSLGFGLDWKELHIAYAFSPGAELGESHRITITGGV